MYLKNRPIYAMQPSYMIRFVRDDKEVELFKEILLLVIGGGGDHNVSHASVQVALICLFLFLNLDMLVAMPTCPTQSWTNVSERVMSILNFALHHCATERDTIESKF